MTQVPEVVLAKEAGICYASVALVTDYDCWRESGEKVCVAEVMKTFSENVSKVSKFVLSIVTKIGQEKWDDTVKELQVCVYNVKLNSSLHNFVFILKTLTLL